MGLLPNWRAFPGSPACMMDHWALNEGSFILANERVMHRFKARYICG